MKQVLTDKQRAARRLSSAKWRAANREKARENSRRWNREHPERIEAARARWKNKRTNDRVLRQANLRAECFCGGLRRGVGRMDKIIAHHMARGRDLGRIVAMLEIPASVVQQAMERIKNAARTEAIIK